MEWIKNLKIAQKLNVLLVLASIISLAIGLTGYLFVQKGAKDMTSLYKDRLLPVAWFSSIKTNANQIQSDLLKLMLTTDKNRKMELISDIKTRRSLNNELFKKYDLHPQIKNVSFRQFEDGYFKEAIQNALVEVIDQVKIKASHPKNKNGRELDGDDLMNQVFGCENQEPQIKFNNLKSSLDKAEQRGLMNLFKGIVGIRDRKAHLNFVQNDPLKTIEYLSLASLLMRLLDENPTTK
jgi:uncharacterized protein (TIGR02391 family)